MLILRKQKTATVQSVILSAKLALGAVSGGSHQRLLDRKCYQTCTHTDRTVTWLKAGVHWETEARAIGMTHVQTDRDVQKRESHWTSLNVLQCRI